MKVESFFSNHTKLALKNEPPGSWIADVPDHCIRLNSGYPESSLVPSAEVKEAAVYLLESEQDLPLQYLGSPSKDRLKRHIQARMEKRGIIVSEEELLITAGACQAIDLIAQVLVDKDTVVAVEAPTYMEAIEIFQNYTDRFITVPIDEEGLRTDLFEQILADRKSNGQPLPRFLYCIPTFQNPTGTTLTPKRRQHLLELAESYNFLIVEDDAYGELGFVNSPQTLKSMDQANRVIYVGSLSKIVAPGLRIGWVSGVKELIEALFWFKKDLEHSYAEATMATYLNKLNFEEHIIKLKESYQKKCDRLLAALETYMPESVSWFVPKGGYFVWVKVPGIDTGQLLSQALSKGVAFVPGQYFFLDKEEGKEYLRLSFSYADEREIVKGIQILGKVLEGKN
ncbi:PLP-dependent aminotransferase family protein [Mesobacillus harenae]|uniref:aminotransferase-like domain-containing protein n=1 Tax=Mesobacillus harenae TaxID=2213203 RepID=UPI001580CD7D|nr:PLP-dependent aminotransferase family protein [Mesobacillus harenae]